MSAQDYEITFEGDLDEKSRPEFEPLHVVERDGVTRLVGRLADQSALHGVLARLEVLNLVLVEVKRRPPASMRPT